MYLSFQGEHQYNFTPHVFTTSHFVPVFHVHMHDSEGEDMNDTSFTNITLPSMSTHITHIAQATGTEHKKKETRHTYS